MTVFVDASVLVAILAQEPDADAQIERLTAAAEGDVIVSPLVLFEATIGLARAKAGIGVRLTPEGISSARAQVEELLKTVGARTEPISPEIGRAAVSAVSFYGKYVGHPAGLNMGDAFVYACARVNDAALLFKGEDFSRTDIPTV